MEGHQKLLKFQTMQHLPLQLSIQQLWRRQTPGGTTSYSSSKLILTLFTSPPTPENINPLLTTTVCASFMEEGSTRPHMRSYSHSSLTFHMPLATLCLHKDLLRREGLNLVNPMKLFPNLRFPIQGEWSHTPNLVVPEDFYKEYTSFHLPRKTHYHPIRDYAM